jgi:hypothetical protein
MEKNQEKIVENILLLAAHEDTWALALMQAFAQFDNRPTRSLVMLILKAANELDINEETYYNRKSFNPST